MDNGFYNQNMGPMVPQNAPGFVKYLILSIVQLMCCCSVTGVISLIFVLLANSSFKQGNFMDYQTKFKSAKTSLIIGWIIGVLAYAVTAVLMVISFTLDMQSY